MTCVSVLPSTIVWSKSKAKRILGPKLPMLLSECAFSLLSGAVTAGRPWRCVGVQGQCSSTWARREEAKRCAIILLLVLIGCIPGMFFSSRPASSGFRVDHMSHNSFANVQTQAPSCIWLVLGTCSVFASLSRHRKLAFDTVRFKIQADRFHRFHSSLVLTCQQRLCLLQPFLDH